MPIVLDNTLAPADIQDRTADTASSFPLGLLTLLELWPLAFALKHRRIWTSQYIFGMWGFAACDFCDAPPDGAWSNSWLCWWGPASKNIWIFPVHPCTITSGTACPWILWPWEWCGWWGRRAPWNCLFALGSLATDGLIQRVMLRWGLPILHW